MAIPRYCAYSASINVMHLASPGSIAYPLPENPMSTVRVRYHTYDIGGVDIHVRSLKDKQQFEDNDGVAEALGISSAQWPLFGVVWESSEILAHEMLTFDIEGKRILEVGCGMALASLVLNHRKANITATDIHPEAGNYLAENVGLNNGKPITFIRTSWVDTLDGLGKFDVIIGSDVLYEREHVELLAGFIKRHSKPNCEVIMVDPGRHHHAPFSKKMISLGFTHQQHKPVYGKYCEEKFKGEILNYRKSV